MDTDKVTRLEVIDHRGSVTDVARVFQANNIHVTLQIQDEGRTLKAFVTEGITPNTTE